MVISVDFRKMALEIDWCKYAVILDTFSFLHCHYFVKESIHGKYKHTYSSLHTCHAHVICFLNWWCYLYRSLSRCTLGCPANEHQVHACLHLGTLSHLLHSSHLTLLSYLGTCVFTITIISKVTQRKNQKKILQI